MEISKRNDRIFFLFYFGYMAIYIARLNLSMASPAMLQDGILTEVQLGFIGSAFSVVYSCGRLFNGVLGDRLAPWLLITAGLLLTGCANLLLGFLPPYFLFLLLWCLNAFGQSMLWSSMLRSMTGLYGKARTDKKAPILGTSIALGNILGILLASWLVSGFGIRAAFLVPGCLTVLTGLVCLRVLPGLPEAPKPPKQEFPLVRFVRDKRIRGQMLPALFHGVIKDNISLWMAVYFLDRFAIDLESSAWYVLLIPLISLASRFLYPVCYRLLGRRENLISMVCFAVSAALSVALCLELPHPIAGALCLSLLYALISMINTSLLSMFPLRFAKENMVSSVSGLADFATYLGAGIGSAVYGFIIARYGYLPMFASWAVLCIVSVILVLRQHPFVKEKENETSAA